MVSNSTTILEPYQERILSMVTLSERWGIHPKVALIRARSLKMPIVQFNARSIGVRLSDVIRVELEATVQ
jgi:hypothetical protein